MKGLLLILFLCLFTFTELFAQSLETLKKENKLFLNLDCRKNDTCSLKKFSLTKLEYRISDSYGVESVAAFETDTIPNLYSYGVVQFIRGCAYWSWQKNGVRETHFGVIRKFFGRDVDFRHPEMVVDSTDIDPLYNSVVIPLEFEARLRATRSDYDLWKRHALYRFNSVHGSTSERTENLVYKSSPTSPVLYIRDVPTSGMEDTEGGLSINVSYQFKTCIFKISDIPLVSTPTSFGTDKAIHCFDWEFGRVMDYQLNRMIRATGGTDPLCGPK